MTEPICCKYRWVQPPRISVGPCKGAAKPNGLRLIGMLPQSFSFDSSSDGTITFWRPTALSRLPTLVDRKVVYEGVALKQSEKTQLYITKLGKGRYQLEPKKEGKFAPVGLKLEKPKKEIIPPPADDQQPWWCELELAKEIVCELEKIPHIEGTPHCFIFKEEKNNKRVVAINLNRLPEAVNDYDSLAILSKVTLPARSGEQRSLLLILRWQGHFHAMRRIVGGERRPDVTPSETPTPITTTSASVDDSSKQTTASNAMQRIVGGERRPDVTPSETSNPIPTTSAKTSCLKRWWDSFTSLFFKIFPFLKRKVT